MKARLTWQISIDWRSLRGMYMIFIMLLQTSRNKHTHSCLQLDLSLALGSR